MVEFNSVWLFLPIKVIKRPLIAHSDSERTCTVPELLFRPWWWSSKAAWQVTTAPSGGAFADCEFLLHTGSCTVQPGWNQWAVCSSAPHCCKLRVKLKRTGDETPVWASAFILFYISIVIVVTLISFNNWTGNICSTATTCKETEAGWIRTIYPFL